MSKVLAAMVAALVVASPSDAGWQGLRWGASSAQVVQLKKLEQPHEATPPDGHTYTAAPYKVGATTFSAAYRFTADKLSQVHLTLTGGSSCSDLSSSLKAKYGKPVSATTSVPNTWIWQDKAAGNAVTLKVFADTFCTIEYEPMVNNLASGL